MIRDQSNGYAVGKLGSVKDVQNHWRAFLAEKGLSPRPAEQKVVAYVNDSRWMANCPWCNGGIICWVENPHGCCLGCGRVYEVKFPPSREIREALELLIERPEHARNWNAHKGETVKELAQENERFLGPKFKELGESLALEPPFLGV